MGGTFSLNGTSAYYNGGNVGIGTLSPPSKLTVSVAGYGIEHTDGTRRLNTYVSASGGWLGTLSNDPLNFFVNGGAASMTVTTGGRVGIGTTTPGGKLTVRTTGAFSAYGIEHTDGTVRLTTYLDAAFGGWIGTRSAHALNLFVNDGTPSLSIGVGGPPRFPHRRLRHHHLRNTQRRVRLRHPRRQSGRSSVQRGDCQVGGRYGYRAAVLPQWTGGTYLRQRRHRNRQSADQAARGSSRRRRDHGQSGQ